MCVYREREREVGFGPIQQRKKKYILKAQLTLTKCVKGNLVCQYWTHVYFETKAPFGSSCQISWLWIEQ